jgi:ribokinase
MTSSPKIKSARPAPVTVLGSINLDVVLQVAQFPKAGETILASKATRHAGGKGANQAIAAARAGAEVRMIGSVGDDADGRFLTAFLQENGVDCRLVSIDPARATGAGYVTLNGAGENQIIVAAGANETAIDDGEVREGVLLAQLEVPLSVVSSFLGTRREQSLTILNAAPFRKGATRLFGLADLVVINETELAAYCGASERRAGDEALAAAARTLLKREGQRIVVTLGEKGSMTIGSEDFVVTASPRTDVVDSTGAGDCFCGFLGAELGAGRELGEAVRTAHQAAALAVRTLGASSSIPTMAQVRRHFSHMKFS